MSRSEHDITCATCEGKILGKYGLDAHRHLFVHIKAWKQGRLIVEVIQTSGVVRVRCPKCLSWHKITIRDGTRPGFEREPLPQEIQIP